MDDRVWYAAYGSNLCRGRLLYYLRGGRPPGASRVYPGCADRRAPGADVAATLPLPLAFVGSSPVWGGGAAFVDPTPGARGTTLARLYLVTREQFAGIVAQENRRRAVRLAGRRAGVPRSYVAGPGRYTGIVACGHRDRRPILTMTAPHRPDVRRAAPPAPAYVRLIAAGLREAHGLSAPQVADYLHPKPGVAAGYSWDELVDIAADA